jgi:palmitoyltransferase
VLPLASFTEHVLAYVYAATVLGLFVATCRSDPGVVTPQNATKMLLLFPPDGDGMLRREQACETCMVMRPARAKHHGGHCVAYFDHYCVWVRNAIGLFNMRYFLGFLLVTSVSCAHGAVLGARQVYLDIYVVRGWRPADHRVLFRVLANRYQLETALVAFLSVASAALFGFFVMQLLQLLRGITSYEYVKLRRMDEATRRRYSQAGYSLEMIRIVLRPHAYLDRAVRKDE